ncbi:MAG: leucine-rich repeat domain-containing protein, partial [Synergistaceae bacterium]|nr:leucine-rich repeat domain-containing protein [Synergistaceae bacterium]
MKEPEDSVRLENVKKAKGNVIELTPHSVRYWNKVVVIGDELEPPDWSEFDGMDSWYALELRNDQSEIPKGAFENNVDLTMITAPSVTSIGEVAFQGCAALESASFPKVRSIGAFAFNECERLRRVSFDLVEQIDDRAFQDCASILDISLPNTLSRLDG